ncbi:MAG: pentapeptide repeat-containing protein [Caldilineaceae bacterium]
MRDTELSKVDPPHTPAPHRHKASVAHRRARQQPHSIQSRSDGPQSRVEHSINSAVSERPEILSHGDFREVEWPNLELNGCDAQEANFSAATLTGICALGANLHGAQFEEAQLQGAALCGANLTSANLRHADLRNANLTWCDLRNATVFAADLRGANLAWADLRNADLRQINLVGAYYNRQTQWPADFDPVQARLICFAESR